MAFRNPEGDGTTVTVYISWGNSDNKLTQLEWAGFCQSMEYEIMSFASRIHGIWFSAPQSAFQNACICAEFEYDPEWLGEFKVRLTEKRKLPAFRQDSIAWAEARTEFI